MAKPTKRRRITRSAVATAPAPVVAPPSSVASSLSPAPPSPTPEPDANSSDTSAFIEYLKAQGFASTLAALNADLANAAQRRRTTTNLSASNLIWANEDTASEVCSLLGMSDLRSCLTVSKAFYRAAVPILYRRLPVRHRNCHCAPPPDRDLDLVARYTTAVELFSHHHVQHYLKPLQIPRLRTTIINYDADSKSEMTQGKGSSLFVCRHCPGKPPKADRLVVRPIAGLFKGKKPATVIVVPTEVTGASGYLHSHQTVAPETIIHVARMTSQTKYTRSFWMQPRPPVETPERKITFILLPIMWDHGPVSNRRPPWGEARSIGNLGSSLIEAMAEYSLHFGDHRIEIVGLEDANPFAMPDHWAARTERREIFEKAFRAKLETLVASNFRYGKWSDEQRDWRRETITLVTFTDYLKSGEWGEEMDWQLVGRWLNTYELREQGMLGTLARKPPKQVNKSKKRARKLKRKRTDDGSDSEGGDDSADSDYVA